MACALQILRRTFTRPCTCPASIQLYHHAVTDAEAELVQEEEDSSFAYVVCKPRTTPLEPIRYVITNEVQMSREAARKQHLQPSLLPQFYTNNNSFSTIDAKTNFEGKQE